MAIILKIVSFIFLGILKLIFSQAVTLIVIPVALIIWIVNSVLIRNCIRLYLLVRYRGKVKLVSDSGDAMFGYKSDGNTRNILIAIEVDPFDGNIKARAKQFEEEIIHKKVNNERPYEKLMWIFTKHLGYFCWKFDENFDINNHFLTIANDEVVTQDRLHEILADCRHEMSIEHPQWQFLFIPRFKNANGVVNSSIICRFHHGILDGISFVLLVSHCLGVLVPEEVDPNQVAPAQPSHSTFPYILNPLTFSVPLKYRIINNINCVLFGFYHLLRTITSPSNHWKLREKYPGKEKNYDYCDKIDTETLKLIRKTCTVSVPSILSCCFLQALENVVGSRIPEKVKIGHSLAFLPYPDEFFHNRFTLMSVSYDRSNNERSRMDKVKAYHRQSNLALQGPEPSLYYWFFQFYGKFPAAMFKFPLKKARFSFFLNNLPFAKKTLSIWGNRILDVKGWPPYTTDAGIGVTSVGYCDTVYACATADSSWLTKDELRLAMIEMHKEVHLLASECTRESV